MSTTTLRLVLILGVALVGCTATEKVVEPTDFAFDGTCVNCHAGLSAGHVHTNYKLRCIDCHGGNDQVATPGDVLTNKSKAAGGGGFRDPNLIKQAHILPNPNIARFFYGNGVDDDGDGVVDEPPIFNATKTQLLDPGEVFEPGLHGEGGGEFMDAELNRDLNYTRFLNPGDLRVASIGCGKFSRGAFDGGGNGSCHQQTIDIVRRGMMVNNAAVTNGAYYGNASFRNQFIVDRDDLAPADDPRFGAYAYSLDYDGPDGCVEALSGEDDVANVRAQPKFDTACLQARAAGEDPTIAAGAQGNAGVPLPGGGREVPSAFEIAQGTIKPVPGTVRNTTIVHEGAGDTRYPWGGNASTGDAHDELEPLLNADLLPGVPDPVDNILRTFRAYYPLNYPASTVNFNFTFGTSILPEVADFKTSNPYGRGHSSGCTSCHTPYASDGSRQATKIRKEDPTDENGDGKLDEDELFSKLVDPTTKHREFDPAKDIGPFDGDAMRLVGRPVKADDVLKAGPVSQAFGLNLDNAAVDPPQQLRTYSQNHTTTTKIDTDTCGLCHGFVTRINYAYQGMAEEEQRDSLSRRGPVKFTTANNTQVQILDSWVREDNRSGNPVVVIPVGVAVVNLARDRDAKLQKDFGLLPGFGGCVPAVFTEDCNNNGELDRALLLEKRDIDGKVIASTTIDEDLNNNGLLDLIDRLPREKAIDGRQVRYVYGGRNGSTRQMDVHFERGMHCIDCHFLQDVHGDGHVYSTNWDAIEIECEDCHGASAKTNFLTSGPNGGNDLRKARNEDLEPFFEERNGAVIQRSRVTTGLTWKVPQTFEAGRNNAYAREAHLSQHVAEPKAGSTFEGDQGSSALTEAKLECATCHNGWITNCMGCHVDINVGDLVRDKLNPDGSIVKSAGENEIWMSNTHNGGHINFQLLGLLRAPFVLGVSGTSEQGRLGTMRSSMQVHASVSDGNGDTLRDNLSFTTFQVFDGNSGRANVATSGVAMNQTMAHTVRPNEARGCEMCHSLVNEQGQTRNEHLMAQTFGIGTGSLAYVGDWIIAAGVNGIDLHEYKKDKELAASVANPLSVNQRFPGLIVDNLNPRAANVEPQLAGSIANDVVLIRNFNATPGQVGGTQGPTLRDLAVIAVENGVNGSLVIADISARGHPSLPAGGPPLGDVNNVDVTALPGRPVALAHLASDVSDPFVYAAVGNAGISVIRILDAPNAGADATLVRTVALPGGQAASDVALGGDLLYVGTTTGNIIVFNINDPENPLPVGSAALGATVVNDIVVNGFMLYVAAADGLAILSLDDPANPARPFGAVGPIFVPQTNPASGVAVSEGHAFVAAGNRGILEIDVRTPALPVNLGTIVPAGQTVDAVDVIVSLLPGQKWIIGLETTGNVVGIKLDGTKTKQERCYPNPGTANCLLELEMYDPTRSGRDPSFDPITGLFDSQAVDPSSPPQGFFRQLRTNATAGRRLARPVFWEAMNTLTGRRYRDSFMPGSGTLSLSVMQNMRLGVLVCELDNASTNPSGLNELGYPVDNVCKPFSEVSSAKAAPRVCKPGNLGPGLHGILCAPRADPKTADPKTAKQPAKQTPLLPATAAIVGMSAGR